MQLILIVILLLLSLIFSLVDTAGLLHVEQTRFEARVKHAETILFGRFNWAIPISNNDNFNLVHSTKQNTYEFSVYCTIKKSKTPDNVSRFIRVAIEHNGRIKKIMFCKIFVFISLSRNGNQYATE
jgi:hypothetical protein